MSTLLSSTQSHDKHLTVTGYVVNPKRTKVLMVHHKKLDKWLPPGGHLEAGELPHEGALREVLEETGATSKCVIDAAEPDLHLQDKIDVQIPRPYAMSYQLIPANTKEEEHIHIDMIYMLETDEAHEIIAQQDEVRDVKWFDKSEIMQSSHVFDAVKSFAQLELHAVEKG